MSITRKHQIHPPRFRCIIEHRRKRKRLCRNWPKIIERISKRIRWGEKATDIIKYPFKLREEARRVDIDPNLQSDLMSIDKMADAGYLTIFDGEEVKIYDMNNTTYTVSRGSVLRGWRCSETGLWRIPLVENVTNLNTDTVVCKAPPTELLPNRPPISEAVHNVYELHRKESDIITLVPASQQSALGWKQLRRDFVHHGQA